jgi:hypothetical protein
MVSTPNRQIVARTEVAAAPEVVFRFLDRLENHARLAPRSVQVLYLHPCPDGSAHALVRLTGPLGVERIARTDLQRTPVGSTYVAGSAALGDRTQASVIWKIEPGEQGSAVALHVSVISASLLDRLLLRFGARRWLEAQLRAALGRLSMQLSSPTLYATEDLLPLTLMDRAA